MKLNRAAFLGRTEREERKKKLQMEKSCLFLSPAQSRAVAAVNCLSYIYIYISQRVLLRIYIVVK